MEKLTFEQQLSNAIEENRTDLIISIIQNAKEGDAAALKAVVQSLEASKYQKQEKLKIAPEQYKQIIKLAAERLTA